MSVYTDLSAREVAAYLSQFSLGDYENHQGISAGIENTNFLVAAGGQQYVLTLFEHHKADEVENFIKIGRHLAEQKVPVPGPIANNRGHYLHELKDKPAILCPCLPGSHPEKLNVQHCIQIGVALARFHLAGEGLDDLEENNRGLRWWPEVGRELIQASMKTELLTDEQQQVLIDEVEFQESNTERWYELPRGLIHGDLFHDNALFERMEDGSDQLGAILDIYNSCQDAWLFDLAIVANDWCTNSAGSWQTDLLPALFAGYQSVRELTPLEQQSWGLCLRGAALRFWMSRLMTQQHQAEVIAKDPMAALVTTEKDPMEYFLKLVSHRETEY
ncbi:MAG: homoserine kinase type II [Oleispira sp.]|jgi:homoserine kinase type II